MPTGQVNMECHLPCRKNDQTGFSCALNLTAKKNIQNKELPTTESTGESSAVGSITTQNAEIVIKKALNFVVHCSHNLVNNPPSDQSETSTNLSMFASQGTAGILDQF